MAPVIVRIHCKYWETELDIRDNVEVTLDDNDSEKIWDICPDGQNCVLAVEPSITSRLRQEFQGFRQLWPPSGDHTTKREIRDCLRAGAVAIADRPKTEVGQCFLDMASFYELQDDLERLLQHDQMQQVYLLRISIDYLGDVIDRLNAFLISEWVLSDFSRKIRGVQQLLLRITAHFMDWEQENSRLAQKGAMLMSWSSAVSEHILQWDARCEQQSPQSRALRGQVYECLKTLENLRMNQEKRLKNLEWTHELASTTVSNPEEASNATTDIEDQSQSDTVSEVEEGSWAMISEGIPEENTK
ncbi:hypothetical protein FQN54_009329 [Arachnomyces sp. PD_36]|nr:hypothetical protein FQN54_009329 [Arachnomyces sp. PD_36]